MKKEKKPRRRRTKNPAKNENVMLVLTHDSGCGALECFSLDLVVFTISGFLPGEYLLRVFPLICKSIQSHRLSLSLLGYSSPPNTSSTTFYDLEGPIEDIAKKSELLQRIMDVGRHSVTALRMNFMNDRCLPCLEKLSIPSYLVSRSFSFDLFPRLTKLEIAGCQAVKTILNWVWKLPLVELSLIFFPEEDGPGPDPDPDDPPAFAQTLRSLKTHDERFLNALAPYCQSLQSLATFMCSHTILAANPGLTSLTVATPLYHDCPPIDLTPCTRLVELKLMGSCPFFSHGTHSQLVHVSLGNPDQGSASRFLSQCPSLKHVTLQNLLWDVIVEITTILDPTKCKRLTLEQDYQFPSLDHVKRLILDRGFQINEDTLLMRTANGQEQWRQVMEMAPQIKDWTLLKGSVSVLPFLTSFNALAAIDIDVTAAWSEGMLSSVVQCCPVLKKLTVNGGQFSGAVQLHSPSLRKLNLQFQDKYSHFDLKLPALTHMSLSGRSGEGLLLHGLLNGNPLIQLPLLSVLSTLPELTTIIQGHLCLVKWVILH